MTENKTDDIELLTKEQAITLVGGKREYIHCFVQNGGPLIGADWEWSAFEECLDSADKITTSGSGAAAMRHPLAVHSGGWRFFETCEDELQ